MTTSPGLIVHIIHRLAVGGLENGLVNLINEMPEARYRHVIICMTDYTDFRLRIKKPGVQCYALHKKPGQDLGLYVRLWRLLRKLKPTIVHTRNIGTLECQLVAFFAGVPCRVHGEHGRDMADIDGSNQKYIILRRLLRPWIGAYITVSRDLEQWLSDTVKISPRVVNQIYSGVDSSRFYPVVSSSRELLQREGFAVADMIVIGTVGQMRPEKNQLTLVLAFISLCQQDPQLAQRLRLMLVGDGPLREQAESLIHEAGLVDCVWFTGARENIPQLLRAMDIFVLPSLGEGISNTILEAMASGLPVVATAVGGNAELVEEGQTGMLVPAADTEALAAAIKHYIDFPQRIEEHGAAGRACIESRFSMNKMVENYLQLYDRLVAEKGS